jgi:NADPH-ferrihemoprotein reductase
MNKYKNNTLTTQHTYARLVKSLPRHQLRHVRFIVFCLGDRAYGDQFCAAGRKLIVRLQQLGAQMVVQPGYGDDGSPGGVWSDLDEWMTSQLGPALASGALPRVAKLHPEPLSLSLLPVQPERYPAPYDIAFGEDDIQPGIVGPTMWDFIQRQAPLTAMNKTVLTGRVVENRRITAPDWHQDTRHIRISVSAPYGAGDVAAILPVNDTESVERFLAVLPTSIQAVADKQMNVHFRGSAAVSLGHPGVCYEHWPTQCTLRRWLRFCADFQALPEREDLRAVSRHCSRQHEMGTDQAERLRHMSDPKGAALYNDYILREKRSWIDLLFDFDSLRDEGSTLTVADLMSLFSPIRTRDFSIASAPSVSSCDYLELCVALVQGTTRLQRKFKGFCSSYLAATSVDSSEQIRLWLRRGTFPPTELDCPLICIAAGTGIAPMRSLLRERSLVDVTSPITLVFGCRRKSQDFYYQEEWSKIFGATNNELVTAFSQETSRKTYVQDVLEETDSLTKAFGSNCYVFIAGNPRMARSVKEKLIEILMHQTGLDARTAKVQFGRLQQSGKVAIEAW